MIRKLARRISGLFDRKAIVLMYHRVAEVDFDPWQLCVSPSNFEQQLAVLQKSFNVIPLQDLLRQLKDEKIYQDCVCITFDDGYADNFLNAAPLLEKYNLPATFFIASKYIGTGAKFWWDELEHILLGSTLLPASLRLTIEGDVCEFELQDTELTTEQIEDQKKWEWPAPVTNDRCRLYLDIWERLLPLDYVVISNVMTQIKQWAKYTQAPNAEEMPMQPQQLKLISDNRLFELGVHTDTHAALPFHTKEYQRNEISACKSYLRANFKMPVSAIAYPYGRYDEITTLAAKEENLQAGFTTSDTIINKKTDPYKLGRVQVCNWNGTQFEQQIKMWSKNG